MIDKKMEKAINKQINWELYSSYLYFSMAAYCDSVNLKGFSHWMRTQAMEELTHVKRFYDFLTSRGGRVIFSEIKAPPTKWNDPHKVFEETLKHEQHVTKLINDLMNLAHDLRDHASIGFLQWFVDEQVEEEESVDDVLQSLRLNENNPGGLFMIDKELAQRTFVPPAGVTI
ncbi:MAG: ferritin [Nitrospiraceae bacterium]|nr:MAG: ferritin [Nitrospiraceae bacterium]